MHTPTDAGPSLPEAEAIAYVPEPYSARAPSDKSPTFEVPAGAGMLNAGDPAGSSADAGRPELVVGAAFAGGLAIAMVLRRLGG